MKKHTLTIIIISLLSLLFLTNCAGDKSHTHDWSEWSVTKEATCAEEGSRSRTCSICNEVETEAIPTIEHSFDEWKVTKSPTFDAEGSESRKCLTCGTTEKRSIDKVLASWDKDAAEWMRQLPDSLSLADITIPGTHDSGAQKGVFGIGQCQSLSITDQLNAGARFLDIRLKLIEDKLQVYHGILGMDMTFDDVQNECLEFLSAHPNETIIMSIKEEDADEAGFANALIGAINKFKESWYTKNSMPTLGEARGKIVFMSRCDSNGKGISCQSNWGDDRTFTMNNGVPMRVQDNYNVETADKIDEKWSDITALITFAHSSNKRSTFCLNFTSGYINSIDITGVSNVINGRFAEYITGLSCPGCYGTFAIDFITADLASALIALNFAAQ